MKKSEMMRLAIPLIRENEYFYICHAIGIIGETKNNKVLANKIKDDINIFLNFNSSNSFSNRCFENYIRHVLNIPLCSPPDRTKEQENFIQFMRVKFMEMMIETYELKGE